MLKQVNAGVLSVAYHDDGAQDGAPVVLLHGFPYDVHAYHDVTPRLVAAGCRVITPYLRGYGPTRFLSPETPRSGQQAVLGNDLHALLDALRIPRAVVAGYDWGGRAACIVSALWPERVIGLVSGAGYNIQHIPSGNSTKPRTRAPRLRSTTPISSTSSSTPIAIVTRSSPAIPRSKRSSSGSRSARPSRCPPS